MFSVASSEAVFGESTSTLSLSHLQSPKNSPTRCNVRYPRGHKRVRQYNMSNHNDGSFQSLSFGSLRSPTGRSDGKISPRRFLQSTTPKTRKRMLESIKGALSERSLNDSAKLEKEERIGPETLKQIQEHKLGIAQMRPKERRIQFRTEKKTVTPTRISKLRVDDLSMHMINICIHEAEKSEAEKQEEEIERLEAGIKKCLAAMERVQKDTKKDIERAAKIRAENHNLLAEIARISPPYKQSIKQAQRQLESNIRTLKQEIQAIDNQLIILNNRKYAKESSNDRKTASLPTKKEGRSLPVLQRKRTIVPDCEQ
ncbi:hypothetical protein FisN_7Lh080 [Fistulifera solaris]|uniref:Uncharacterized protein n=1 Tax=Fistulifera solaris TaxID=1519565 RepID=A0A1Z5JCI1_FISSO|nr:hypothetical protein FisN_7Lh080 [Fistulifera solaris]|eukprot:GAX11710.1 hypothetical protein FisN_7Lh080 [Fistulifera solaris]